MVFRLDISVNADFALFCGQTEGKKYVVFPVLFNSAICDQDDHGDQDDHDDHDYHDAHEDDHDGDHDQNDGNMRAATV